MKGSERGLKRVGDGEKVIGSDRKLKRVGEGEKKMTKERGKRRQEKENDR